MAENQTHETEPDPSASTQMFRAFVAEAEAEVAHRPKVGGRALLVVAGLLVLVAVVAAVAVF